MRHRTGSLPPELRFGPAWPTCEELSTNHRFSTGGLLAFAVHRKLQFLLPIALAACTGCAGPTRGLAGKTGLSAPRYGWLRKQGKPVDANTSHAVPAADLSANGVLWPSANTATRADSNGYGPDLERTVAPSALAWNDPAPAVPAPAAQKWHPEKHLPAPHPANAKDSTEYFAPEPRHWNTKAIAAAPAALATVVAAVAAHSVPVLVVGGAIAFALGLIGSRQCRDREDRGKGFALVGMVIGAVALFVGLMAVILTA